MKDVVLTAPQQKEGQVETGSPDPTASKVVACMPLPTAHLMINKLQRLPYMILAHVARSILRILASQKMVCRHHGRGRKISSVPFHTHGTNTKREHLGK